VPPTGSSASVFTKNTTSCRFFLANAVCRCCASHPAKQSWEKPGDRQKLEQLSSRKTRRRVVFSWQTQFAGAALRILRSSRGRSRGIGRSSSSCLHEKHDVVSFFLGKRSLPVLRFASCEAVVGEAGGSAEARGAVFTKNTTSCRFFLANAVCRCCASHPAKQSWEKPGDRQKLEELSSRKTRRRVVFSWQTQFAGAALRILRSSRGRSRGIGRSSSSVRIFRPSGECAAVGRGRRKSRSDETSAVPRRRVANRAATGTRTAWTGSTFQAQARCGPTQFAQAARPPRGSPLPD
jgi:hypothetical protein